MVWFVILYSMQTCVYMHTYANKINRVYIYRKAPIFIQITYIHTDISTHIPVTIWRHIWYLYVHAQCICIRNPSMVFQIWYKRNSFLTLIVDMHTQTHQIPIIFFFNTVTAAYSCNILALLCMCYHEYAALLFVTFVDIVAVWYLVYG